jgi:hypothetical protein
MATFLEHTTDTFSLQLFPTYDYVFKEVYSKSVYRTKTGDLGIYVNTPTYFKFEIPVGGVTSSDVSIITSWWVTGTSLNYYPDTDVDETSHVVRIMGNESPFQKYSQRYAFTEWDGIIVIETI